MRRLSDILPCAKLSYMVLHIVHGAAHKKENRQAASLSVFRCKNKVLPICVLIIAAAHRGKEYSPICSNEHNHEHNANQRPHEHRLKVIGLALLCARAECPYKHHDDVQAGNAQNECCHHPVRKAYRLLELTVAGPVWLLLLIRLLVRLLLIRLLVWLLLVLSLVTILVPLVE